MKFILAEKMEMTQRFQEDGKVVPVTLLQVNPCTVTQVKTEEADGYSAVQIGTGEAKKPGKALSGHLKKSGSNAKTMREFRVAADAAPAVGDKLDASLFNAGEFVDVTGTTKGQGFQGVVKRHNFKGSPASHGHKDQLRMPGSIGATGNAKVFKGTRMPGNMGNERQTTKNLEIVDVDAKTGVIAVKGAVPGARGGLLLVAGGHEKKQSWN